VLRSTAARASARSCAEWPERGVDERAQRPVEPVAVLAYAPVDVGLAGDGAQLGGAALVARERLAHEPLDTLGRLGGVLQACRDGGRVG
jgi:hypothetical protein